MDSSNEERSNFSRITSVLRSSESDITEPGVLSMELIEQVRNVPCLLMCCPFLSCYVFNNKKGKLAARHQQKWIGSLL